MNITGPQLQLLSVLSQAKGIDLTNEAKKLGKTDITEISKEEAKNMIEWMIRIKVVNK